MRSLINWLGFMLKFEIDRVKLNINNQRSIGRMRSSRYNSKPHMFPHKRSGCPAQKGFPATPGSYVKPDRIHLRDFSKSVARYCTHYNSPSRCSEHAANVDVSNLSYISLLKRFQRSSICPLERPVAPKYGPTTRSSLYLQQRRWQ